MRRTLYLDHNATTRPDPLIQDAFPQWLKAWGNPSSIHQIGRGPKALLRVVRQQVASLIGSESLEVIFTSGGSESNNLAIKGVFFNQKKIGSLRNHYLFSTVEHPSVIKTAQFLESQGAEVEWIPVSREGEIDLDHYKSLLRPTTALVSVMFANNETGTIFPIKKMTKLAHEVGALFHTDAVQALGKSLINVKDLDVDLASFAGHKFYALRGSGVLYSKRGTQLESLIHGGGHERSRRAGTENLIAVASLGLMAGRQAELPEKIKKMTDLRDQMEKDILFRIPHVKVTASNSKRLPNTSSFVIRDVDGETLLMNLDLEGLCVSTGAACSSGSQEPSPALRAMGLSREEAQSSLRISLGWDTTEDEIQQFCDILVRIVNRLRNLQQENLSL